MPDPQSTPCALVTGASSGIGRAFARRIARDGFRPILVARREERLSEVAREIETLGATAEVVVADLTTSEGLAAVEKRVAAGDPGTTWVQQIVSQLIFAGADGLPVAEMSPWLDLRVPPKAVKLPLVEAQTHRRFLKTHLPVDALVFSPKAKYIYIGRDGRDVVWSMYNHHANANALWYEALNDTPGLVGDPIAPPPASVVEYFRDWLARDGHPFWPFWENVRSWWAIHDLPNVQLVHFQRLKDDMPGGPMQRWSLDFVSDQLADCRRFRVLKQFGHLVRVTPMKVSIRVTIELPPFRNMKANAASIASGTEGVFIGGWQTFFNKGPPSAARVK